MTRIGNPHHEIPLQGVPRYRFSGWVTIELAEKENLPGVWRRRIRQAAEGTKDPFATPAPEEVPMINSVTFDGTYRRQLMSVTFSRVGGDRWEADVTVGLDRSSWTLSAATRPSQTVAMRLVRRAAGKVEIRSRRVKPKLKLHQDRQS